MKNKPRTPKGRAPKSDLSFEATPKQMAVLAMALAKVKAELNITDNSVALAALCAKYSAGDIKIKKHGD